MDSNLRICQQFGSKGIQTKGIQEIMNREVAKANVAVEMLVPTPGLEPGTP